MSGAPRVALRADDIVARIGGDEFAVLLPGADRERAEATAERLVEAVEVKVEHGVTASVGVGMLDPDPATAGRGHRYVVLPIACSAVGRIVSSGT